MSVANVIRTLTGHLLVPEYSTDQEGLQQLNTSRDGRQVLRIPAQW